MTAKKTTVTLPGGLAGLVHAAQQGGAKAPATAATTPAADSGADTTRHGSAQPEPQSAPTEAKAAATAADSSPKAAGRQPRRAQQEASAPAAAAISDDDYRRAISSGETRWQLFEQLARQYHRASGLSAVYIDDDLKRAIARLRASGMGVSASAILSAIVRQFLIENADSVRDTIGQP